MLRWCPKIFLALAATIIISLCCPSLVSSAKVITMGDSFSAGAGIHAERRDYDDKPCSRELDTTPGARLDALDESLEAIMVACGGAEVFDLQVQLDYLLETYDVFDDRIVSFEGSTILLTLGLNELRSVGGLHWLVLLLKCTFCIDRERCAKDPDNQVANLEDVKASLRTVLQNIVSEASQASIRILGYGLLFQRNGNSCKSFWANNALADLMDNEYFDAINQVSAAVVAELQSSNPGVDIQYIDPTNYLNVGSCDPNSDLHHLNGFMPSLTSFPFPFSRASFHPSQLGYDQYLQALIDSFGLV